MKVVHMKESKKKNKTPQMPNIVGRQPSNSIKDSIPALFGGVIFLLFAAYLIFMPYDFAPPLPTNNQPNHEVVEGNESSSSKKRVDYHQFGNLSFVAKGTWKTEMEGPVTPDHDQMYSQIITSHPYQIQMTTAEIPPDKVNSVKEGLVEKFRETNSGVQDFFQNDKDSYFYAAGWDKAIIDGTDQIEAMYSIMDTESNVYTMISIVGPVQDKATVLDIFKSVEYKGTPLYK